jgi:drug/metabolite transporter (DMT)-like permease
MIYLTLSEATALTFLGPLGSLILTRYLSFATVKWSDCVGAVGALVGVMLIAQPEGMFSTSKEVYTVSENTHNRLYGLGFGVFGFCGGVVSDESHRFVNWISL